jgi:hypothetical protein
MTLVFPPDQASNLQVARSNRAGRAPEIERSHAVSGPELGCAVQKLASEGGCGADLSAPPHRWSDWQGVAGGLEARRCVACGAVERALEQSGGGEA